MELYATMALSFHPYCIHAMHEAKELEKEKHFNITSDSNN
jgi:hypothetical protein